jgi:predicted phosphate transport protein (TIGR00153 family)
MRLALVPRPSEFYGLFTEAGVNAVRAARQAEALFREHPDSTVTHAEVKAIETEGDRLTRDIIRLLNTQYVTPFDREDIYELAGAIDDVVDHIEHACDLLGLYRIEAPMEQSLEQCRVLVAAAEALAAALSKLRGLKGAEADLVEVKRLEDEGDRIVRDAIAALFEDEDVSPRAIIRWKDIFEALEDALDACERAANVVGNIVVKNG